MSPDKKILVNTKDLRLLLESKSRFIGTKVIYDSIISSTSFLISVILASYDDFAIIPGYILRYFFIFLGIIFEFKAFFDIYKSKKNAYNYSDLFDDVNKLNEISYPHSIVIIKDTFNDFSNRYLVYDDDRWNCKFFLNYKRNENNEDFIKKHISNDLKIDIESIKLQFVTRKIHQKFSVSNNEDKIYDHAFYLAEISKFSPESKKDTFTVDKRNYFWLTMPELDADKQIQEKNLDVLNIIKGNF